MVFIYIIYMSTSSFDLKLDSKDYILCQYHMLGYHARIKLCVVAINGFLLCYIKLYGEGTWYIYIYIYIYICVCVCAENTNEVIHWFMVNQWNHMQHVCFRTLSKLRQTRGGGGGGGGGGGAHPRSGNLTT